MQISAIFKTTLTIVLVHACYSTIATPLQGSPGKILQRLILEAKSDAQSGFEPIVVIKNEALNNLSYQQYRAIRFNPQKSIWRGISDYEAQLFHSGFLYKQPVKINFIDFQNRVYAFPFDSSLFSYDNPSTDLADKITNDVGYAGFRLHYPLNMSKYKDEFAVFLGATYFRLIGKHQHYGISARGVAINTGEAEGEEFPVFSEFWLIEPTSENHVMIYARVDSPSLTGMFKFIISADNIATANIEAWLFAREDIDKLGVAPFTSMYLYGENSTRSFDDFRPEVHDSDGIVLFTNKGEQIWRPLDNPKRLRITSLSDSQPQKFGMLQRDIQYSNYLDAEAHYHQRPGLIVTPEQGFAQGRLELVEIPTNSETHDNIVAYWVNQKPVKEGASLYFKYKVQTVSGQYEPLTRARVLRTSHGTHFLPGDEVDDENLTRRFVIDFSNPNKLDIEKQGILAKISASNASVSEIKVFNTNFNNEIRATFLLTPEQSNSLVDLRLHLEGNEQGVSEVWNYIYE